MSFIDFYHFIRIHLPNSLVRTSLALICFQVLSSALAKQKLMMFVKMEMAIMYVRHFVINKNVLAAAIFEKKMFKSFLEITKNICQYVATKVK